MVARSLLRPGPSFLGGWTPEQVALLRAAAARRFTAPEHAQLEAADKILASVEQARTSFVQKFAKLKPRVKRLQAVDESIAALATAK
jgi:GAF domain-containing protein